MPANVKVNAAMHGLLYLLSSGALAGLCATYTLLRGLFSLFGEKLGSCDQKTTVHT